MPTSTGARLAGSAAAAAAIGFLIGPVPVHAQPPAPLAPADCASYQFPGGTVSLNYPDPLNAHTEFDTIAGGTHVDTKAVTKYQQSDMPGTVIGDIKGNKIHLTVTREGTSRDYPPLILDGEVGADDRAHGTVTYKGGDPASWDSVEPMKCIPASAPVQQAPAQANTAIVSGGDADVFNIAHNDVPDPTNGIAGAKIATLPNGTQVNLDGACKAGWCRVNSPQIPQGFGFVEQGHLAFG
jgi:hypothetical protein